MPRRSATDAARTREAIAAAARAAFAVDGYAGASTARIARDAGVSEGALFHHFRTKAALFREVFVTLEGELDAHVRAASRDGAPIDAFLAGCRASMQFGTRPDYQRVVLVDGPTVLGDAEWRKVDAQLGLATVARGLRNLAGRDNLSAEAARPLSVLVMGALNEVIFALARKEEGVEIEACLDALARMLSPWMDGQGDNDATEAGSGV
ncbi:MAG: TetR/AcrR family transcriptional regulator [Caulobacter sp.]|nr:TetR/AcrR family transcriptional regulator [Caulobacter sp.]